MDDIFELETVQKTDLNYQNQGQFGAFVNMKKVEMALDNKIETENEANCVKEAKEVARLCQAFDREGEFYCASAIFDELHDCFFDLDE